MFSKTIFKQTLRQNWKLWAIFTALSALMSAVIIAVYDPRMFQTIIDALKSTPGVGEMFGEYLSDETTLLSMLGNSFYSLQGVILPLVFIIMTSNSLIASQVDRGSMAYTLSTPIKRIKVVSTQAIYMITSVFCMFLVVTAVGFASAQISHKALWGESFTPDVIAISEKLNLSKEELADDPRLILNDEEALKAGAEARMIDEDVYKTYLNMKLTEKAYAAAAAVLGVDVKEVSGDLKLIKNNEEALNAAADVLEIPPAIYAMMLDTMIAYSEDPKQEKEMTEKFLKGLDAAAEELGDSTVDMVKIKNSDRALEAAAEASGFTKEEIVTAINQALAGREMRYDLGVDFNAQKYINLNLGIFLLMFAISGIAFMFSCIFNLTKNSLAFGAGIPIACLILQIMSQASKDLEFLKYLSLNTLFDPSEITGGGTFLPQFIIMAVLGIATYLVGIKVFKEKDLPL